MVEPLDLGPIAVREQLRLERAQSERPHHPNGVGGEVSPTVLDMMRDHGEESILRREWLDQMSGSELGVIGDGVGPADFEFHPDASSSDGLPEEDIGLRSVTEDGFDAGRHHTGFRHAFPSGGAMHDEGVLKLTGKAGYRRKPGGRAIRGAILAPRAEPSAPARCWRKNFTAKAETSGWSFMAADERGPASCPGGVPRSRRGGECALWGACEQLGDEFPFDVREAALNAVVLET